MMQHEFQIIPVHPDILVQYWDKMRLDIKQVERKSGTDYQPIDVLREIKKGKAFAAILENKGHHIGTLILRPLEEEFSKKKILHVWILALEQSRNGGPDLMDNVWKYVENQAKEAGVNLIQVISDRPGWERRLKRYGFKQSQYRAYHREIDNE